MDVASHSSAKPARIRHTVFKNSTQRNTFGRQPVADSVPSRSMARYDSPLQETTTTAAPYSFAWRVDRHSRRESSPTISHDFPASDPSPYGDLRPPRQVPSGTSARPISVFAMSRRGPPAGFCALRTPNATQHREQNQSFIHHPPQLNKPSLPEDADWESWQVQRLARRE